jgi:hypothetical protein
VNKKYIKIKMAANNQKRISAAAVIKFPGLLNPLIILYISKSIPMINPAAIVIIK